MSKFGYTVIMPENPHGAVEYAAKDFAYTVKLITGKSVKIDTAARADKYGKKIFLSLFDENSKRDGIIRDDCEYLAGSDGFSVRTRGGDVTVTAHTPAGLFFGIHDLLEKNADVIYSRGADDMAVDYVKTDDIEFAVADYREKSSFKIRAYQPCGEGKTGTDHVDDGTALYLARNKVGGTAHCYSDEWSKFGLKGVFAGFNERTALDGYIDTHPEYFMHEYDGRPRKGYTNYYNKDVPEIYAEKWAQANAKGGADRIYGFGFPDDPYFCMIENGERLDKKPFVTDDGTTVYPCDANYKSTVYCNFLNRLMRAMKKRDKNARLFTLAYIYSEAAPAIGLEDGITVLIAAITTNERYSFADELHPDNVAVKNNILAWREKCNDVGVYAYWNSFKGNIYSRPILKQVKENLSWLRSIGVTCLDIEGNMDCSRLERYSERQAAQRKLYDMNEAYIYVLLKLLWNPDADVDAELKRYARIVYKESAGAMLDYFAALQRGWDESDATVWYSTGGDVYTLDFIINAGEKDAVLSAVTAAKDRAVTPRVKEKTLSIYRTVTEQLKIYGDFIREKGIITRVKKDESEILDEKNLDLENNPGSVWNKTVPMKIFRNYQTMEFFDEKAKFDCRMIANDYALFVGYRLYDDRIVGAKRLGDNYCAILSDGKELFANAENYIGGNSFNKSVYYGYMSGFAGGLGQNLLYENAGTPRLIPLKKGMKDVKYVHTDENPEKRYVFHVQVIPYSALGVEKEDFKPYGSIVYLTDRYGRAGWMGYGLWCKQSFSEYEFRDLEEVNEKN